MRYREQQPTFIPPMLLTSRAVPSGDGWALEVKWDGCRAQLRYDGRSASLRMRNGRECSADFPELADIADELGGRRVTLDGELVCLRSDGRPDFARLRHRLTELLDTRDELLGVDDHHARWRSPSRLGLEGVVAKRLSSTYIPGRRCTAWVKHLSESSDKID